MGAQSSLVRYRQASLPTSGMRKPRVCSKQSFGKQGKLSEIQVTDFVYHLFGNGRFHFILFSTLRILYE